MTDLREKTLPIRDRPREEIRMICLRMWGLYSTRRHLIPGRPDSPTGISLFGLLRLAAHQLDLDYEAAWVFFRRILGAESLDWWIISPDVTSAELESMLSASEYVTALWPDHVLTEDVESHIPRAALARAIELDQMTQGKLYRLIRNHPDGLQAIVRGTAYDQGYIGWILNREFCQ